LKYVPLTVGGPFIILVASIFWVRSKLRERRAAQSLSAVIDDSAFDSAKTNKSKKKKTKPVPSKSNNAGKKNGKVTPENSNSSDYSDDNDDDDDVDLSTFAKGGKKKRK